MSIRPPLNIVRNFLLDFASSVVAGGGAGTPMTPTELALDGIPVLLLSSSELEGTYSDTDPVTDWPDLSGNANDAAEATVPPFFSTGDINSVGTVEWALADKLRIPSSTDFDFFTNNAGATIITTFKRESGSDFASIILGRQDTSQILDGIHISMLDSVGPDSGNGDYIAFSVQPNTISNHTSVSNGFIINGFPDNNFYTFVFVINAAFTDVRVFRAWILDTDLSARPPLEYLGQATLDGSDPDNSLEWVVGAFSNNNSFDLDGQIAYIAMYDTALDNSELLNAAIAPHSFFYGTPSSFTPFALVRSGTAHYGTTYVNLEKVETDVTVPSRDSKPVVEGQPGFQQLERAETNVSITIWDSKPVVEGQPGFQQLERTETDVVL